MSRQLSTSQPTLRLQTKQLGTAVRRTQRNQVNAMVRLADRLFKKVDQDGLETLIGKFKDFAIEYATTLDNANQSGQLSFLLRSGIERLLQEWNILSRACEQRRETNPKYMKSEDRQESTRYYLEQADAMLASYCARWKSPDDPVYVPLQTPVVYFEKLYRISRALFAPDIPVISIPLSDYDAPDRWQALAHEIGHHIFWNGVTLDEFVPLQNRMCQAVMDALCRKLGVDFSTAEEAIVGRLNLWNLWMEEVFADICGVLFAGPMFALSAQDLAAVSVSKDTELVGVKNDAHPSLYLRPLIALQVVREIADRSSHPYYRDKLMAWAGMGEEVTRGRVPSYEDQLRMQAAREARKSVGGEYDLPVNRPSLSDRWLAFAPKIGKEEYPGAHTTLDDLAGDVPLIVHTLLNKPVWPGDRCLWDLICCHAGQECRDDHRHKTIDDDLADLDRMSWTELPDITSPIFPEIPSAPSSPHSDFEKVLSHLVTTIMAAEKFAPDVKAKLFWTLFAAMEIEADAAAYHTHEAEDIVSHSHHVPDPPIRGRLSVSVTWKHSHDAAGRHVYWII
ncbi:hypothetical protein [Candidatus Amarolinea dominans]|uniref:hypothetical protein n=2 Tax=Candidatus Amarolinea dominans TaxID=3140696 RepID=UPI001DCEA839|nr:hypothetical protein [Anaerolineae bacterium]